MYTSKTSIKVRYAETDKMGIVYHSNYYVYFEVAREDFIKGSGITYKEMEDSGVMMPLAETHCKYMNAARYADELIVETSMKELSPVKVVLEYNVTRKSDGVRIAKGRTVQAFVDSSIFKIINLKKQYPAIWDKLRKLGSEE